ncbi:hypothetical protein EHW99_1141 [Erwinia amylovora]|uniref:Uncharacterized protein n=3 Tax=Erwinia amylovora TaxID=552 RepID=A0A830ZUH9_ERWAM|nr:hypothetical protein EaACW_2474 [Erwinia amylovora ACW56400]QJQ53848.1 hypothetical protein EHX00_1141 [Erwinia amylovora]CBA21760.1 hypothetical protein predicted by Glimmer/Critica [Erwinia amylovora CFBP1430]CBX81341.1 hypothetical protein predicted by Glimmer/Critica [Erwinia amylovora ATCC BAA-2158]CCO79320.1 hypothetical protein BN432_2534 [Erwinia amylovora Ea356]CCO83125.1 hypothetical protein BN433_2566 [Erwinia amylovora Ea266]CCO86887.1 hypothetical protein BN434_2510 [Erwinia a
MPGKEKIFTVSHFTLISRQEAKGSAWLVSKDNSEALAPCSI